MPAFTAPDGTVLAFRAIGEGEPLICLPGGMQGSAYLGDLGGLREHRRLILLDPRGTGESGTPDDPATYRCDRMVGDVEALREHLGLDRFDLLAHCAGANLAALYLGRHSERVRRAAFITPSTMAAGLFATGDDRLELARLRAHEPWFPGAYAALRAIVAGESADFTAIDPFFYGRWDDRARAHLAAQQGQRNDEAAATFGGEGAYDPEATRAALGAFTAPVFVLAAEHDMNSPPVVVARFAALFPAAGQALQPGAGHYPWVDDAETFVATVSAFLR
ncbi:alpha/beta fold hydrolase [Nonomuraea soli]|uniref:Pimeloyl-ACP methyl ester carboxylesterase n=1 Tax=Nonomuraea soli TaxID=1032476 RepID=A0A7W0HP46_9ACTN|nr:alpha/beta hydrolase [Nonomuraea soli]MBA2890485.1 pimeloyl-ACP methyl ester carboxylesterase [Nonomuraea soli]